MTPNLSPSVPAGVKTKVTTLLFTLFVICSFILTACGGSNQQSGNNQGSNKKVVLTIGTQDKEITKSGFNLFSSLNNAGIYDLAGFVYEPLYFSNINDGSYTPLLATSYHWNNDNTQLTFTIRQNVKWNDGQPFSANDVAFTFNELKQYPAADLRGVWSYLKSVVAPDANTVVATFQKPYVPAFWYIAAGTFIIPQHIFASVGDPTRYINDKPVGTGPFVIGRYNPQVVVYEKNPNYWQADKVKVDEIRLPFIKDNDAALLALSQGQLDWAGFFASGLQSAFINKDSEHNHYWMAPVDEFGLFPNLTNPLLSNVAVRQAINAALDRNALSTQGEAGLAPPLNATALVLPGAKDYLDPNYANLSNSPDVAKAQKYLTDAGFTKGSDGIFMDKSGRRLSFKLRTVSIYSDWNQMALIMQQNLKAVGIELKIDAIAESEYYTVRADNNYDLEIGGLLGGPTPYYIYYEGLSSKLIGQSNYERWNNPATDQLLQQYATTGDQNKQKQIIMSLEKTFVEQLPWIPLAAGPRWFEYRTTNFTGWPNQNNPYAAGSPYQASDNEIIVMHLTPAS